MALPVLEAYTTDSHTGDGEGSVTLSKPSGTTTGDVLVFLVADDSSSSSSPIITPSGLTKETEIGTSATDTHLLIYTRVVDGTEPSSWTFTDENEFSFIDVIGYCLRISNYAGLVTPVEEEQSSASSIALTGLTTTAEDSLLIAAVSFDGADNSPLFTGATNSFVKETEENTRGTGSFGTTLGFFTRGVSSTGTYSTTISANSSDGMSAALFAISGTEGGGTSYEEITQVTEKFDSQASNSTNLDFPVTGQEDGDFEILLASSDALNNTALSIELVDSTGWTNQLSISTTAGRDRDSELWTRFYETDDPAPEVTINEDYEYAGVFAGFRGVDQTNPLDATIVSDTGTNTPNPTPPEITTVTPGAAIVTILSLSNDDVTVPGAPTGYTLSESSTTQDRHRQVYLAYLLDAGEPGLKTVPAWTHTTDDSVAEYHAVTLALRPAEASTENTGTGSGTTPSVTSSSTGVVEKTSSGAGTTESITSDASGFISRDATGAGNTPSVTSSAAATREVTSSGAVDTPSITSSASGDTVREVTGVGSTSSPSVSSSATGIREVVGTSTSVTTNVNSEANGSLSRDATGEGTTPSVTSSASGVREITSSGDTSTPLATSTGAGAASSGIEGLGSVIIPSVSSDASGVLERDGTSASVIVLPTSSAQGVIGKVGTATGTTPSVTGQAEGSLSKTVTGAGAIVIPFVTTSTTTKSIRFNEVRTVKSRISRRRRNY